MTARTVRHAHGGIWDDGPRLANASLLAIPGFIVWMLLLMPVGWALQAALDLDDSQLLYEAGGWGWVAYVAMVLTTAVPPAVGTVLGVRARRLGERRRGTVGTAANVLVGLMFVLAPVLAALVG